MIASRCLAAPETKSPHFDASSKLSKMRRRLSQLVNLYAPASIWRIYLGICAVCAMGTSSGMSTVQRYLTFLLALGESGRQLLPPRDVLMDARRASTDSHILQSIAAVYKYTRWITGSWIECARESERVRGRGKGSWHEYVSRTCLCTL